MFHRSFYYSLPPLTSPPPLLLILALLLSTVHCTDLSFPPEQQHVYFSGNHISSIVLQPPSDAQHVARLHVTDIVHDFLVRYNATGRFLLFSYGEGDSFRSITSAAYLLERVFGMVREWLFISRSIRRRVMALKPDPNQRAYDGPVGAPLTIPPQMYEAGVAVTPGPSGEYQTYMLIIDRYRGYAARYDIINSEYHRWLSRTPPSPASSSYNTTFTYLPAATATNDELDIVYVVDGVGDRVLRLNASSGEYMEPLLVELPDDVRGIQAVSWTWCGEMYSDMYGCLWLMYSDGLLATEQTVIAVSLRNGTVLHRWTAATAGGEEGGEVARAAAPMDDHTRREQRPAVHNAHLASPAFTVTGHGNHSDPFRVWMAADDPNAPGHVIVVWSENGTLLLRFDSLPLPQDVTKATMHAFAAVAVENITCTLWLTDVDNGGMLVRAADDGTILQHFPTPALFTSVVIDYSSDPSSPSLVLLFANASEWQLWRFYPVYGTFVPVDTTAAQQQARNSSRWCGTREGSSGTVDMDMVDDATVTARGLSVDSAGRLLVSLTLADKLLMLHSTGQLDEAFNASCELVRPALAVFSVAGSIVAVDRSGQQGGWYFQSLDGASGEHRHSAPFAPPMA